MAGASIEGTTDDDIKDYQGIRLHDGAKIFIHPSFGITLKEIQSKISGYCKISKRSILWLEGEDTYIKDLELDSTLITNNHSGEIEGEFFDEKFIEYVPLDPEKDNFDALDEIVKIRGFKVHTHHQISGLNFIATN